jgi:hypothetical protein
MTVSYGLHAFKPGTSAGRRRAIKFWTRSEERELLARRQAGETYSVIAKRLNRGLSSVRARGRDLGLGKSTARWEAPVVRQYDFIPKAALPEWYALGWTVRSFSGDEITVEWAHLATPRRP